MDFKNCIVGVLVDGELKGTGYVVTEKLVITCAHVLTNESEPPTHGLSVRFHCSGEEYPVTANGTHWSSAAKDDIAALELGKPLPAEAELAKLARSAGRKNRECEVFGYPDIGKLDGLGGRATIIEEVRETEGRRLLQLRSAKTTLGYSGCPLLDSQTGEVIGTVVEMVERALFATPMEVIADLIPLLPIDSVEDVDAHQNARRRVRDGIQKILANESSATHYLAEQIGGMENERDPSQRISEHLLDSALADFLPLVIRGFTTHVATEPAVAKAFRDLATYVLPQIYKADFLREIRRRLNSGDNFFVIPASHKSIIELVVAGVLGQKLSFDGAWQFHGGIPSGNLSISPSGEFGILHGDALVKFVASFEDAILQKIGGLAQEMPNPTKAINRKLEKLKNDEPPIRYFYVYPDGQSRVEELEQQFPDVVFISHELTDHDDAEFDLLDDLKKMFCAESDQ